MQGLMTHVNNNMAALMALTFHKWTDVQYNYSLPYYVAAEGIVACVRIIVGLRLKLAR